MKKIFIIIISAILFAGASILNAQECTVYLPENEGTVLEFYNYDKKDKLTGITKTKITSVETNGDTTYYKVHQELLDENKELIHQTNLQFKCSGGKFYIDMNSLLGNQQMEAYQDMEMDIDVEEMWIPGNLESGQTLKDGSITINIKAGPAVISNKTKFTSRNVMAIEDITTPAGTFNAAKISTFMETKTGFVTIKSKSIDWYVEGIGVVRTETYDKKDNLTGYTVLNSISK